MQSCLEGDRLELGGVSMKPHKEYLSESGFADCAGLEDELEFASRLNNVDESPIK